MSRGVRPSVLNAHYVTDWPRSTDLGIVAIAGPRQAGEPESLEPCRLGAAWLRHFPAEDPGYGHVAPDIPELTIALVPDHRGVGLGRALLRRLLATAAQRGITRVSLSVEPGNPAIRLYASEGFVPVGTDAGGSLTMLRHSREPINLHR